ncbi:unannotated protein [freshwater metagenome]|uniref:Unannotated protein n=1 Tax=freshwater metagenome TaxID=449393 RepID=A0A6J7DY36_9ZZZZ
MTNSHVVGNGLHDHVTRSHGGVLGNPKHSGCLIVERCQLIGPVSDVNPLRVGEVLLARHVQGIRIVQTPTADSGPGKYHHILKYMYALQPGKAQLWGPQEPR